MSDPQIAALQRALRSGDHTQAWTDFLTSYSPVVLTPLNAARPVVFHPPSP